MNNPGEILPFNKNGEIDNDSWIESNRGDINFTKYFGRSFRDVIDKRFLLIWIFSFVIHFSAALYFAINPPQTGYQRESIDRIQKQFATFILARESEHKAVLAPEASPAEKIIPEKGSVANRPQKRNATILNESLQFRQSNEPAVNFSPEPAGTSDYFGNEKQRASREQLSREVSLKGLLGLLTGSGNQASGKDVLGEAETGHGNLEKVLEDLDGIRKADKKGGGIITQSKGITIQKGGRATETGGIDELIAEKEQVQSAGMERKGTIIVEQVTAIADERGIKSASRDPYQVSEVINRHNSSIQYCYQRELKQNPDLKGKLVIRFTVTPEGKVKDATIISSTLNSPNIERCVISRIKKWDDFGPIDPSKGDATFRQVYTFGY